MTVESILDDVCGTTLKPARESSAITQVKQPVVWPYKFNPLRDQVPPPFGVLIGSFQEGVIVRNFVLAHKPDQVAICNQVLARLPNHTLLSQIAHRSPTNIAEVQLIRCGCLFQAGRSTH